MAQISFTPSDFDSVVTIEDLTGYLVEIIQNIRQSNSYGKELLNKIDDLEKYANDGLSKNSSLEELFDAYKKIIAASMEIRLLLSNYMSLEVYDSITYAFYYNNERFSTENISISWLRKASNGTLKLNLNKATQEIKQNFNDELQNKVINLFNQHYTSYLNAIMGMYKGNRLNRGHIAEAYEAHLAEHHSQVYSLLNTTSIESVADKMILANAEKDLTDGYWADHEDPDEAWRHIRSSLGTQRGTVAGDVGRVQVKQARKGDQVRLATLKTLKDGVKSFSDILNPDLDIESVARRLASYLSEPVTKTDKNLQAYIANKELADDINSLSITRLVNI